MTENHNNAAHRYFWKTIGAILAGWAILQGTGYVSEGNEFANSPSYNVMESLTSMRSWGLVMILVGILLIVQITNVDRLGRNRICLRVFFGFCLFVSLTIFGSWSTTGEIVFGAPLSWIAFALISAAMTRFPPPPKIEEGSVHV